MRYLFVTYKADDVIAKTVGDIIFVNQGKCAMLAKFSTFLNKVLRCGNVYSEFQLKKIFLERLNKLVRDAIRVHCGHNYKITIFQ